MGNDNEVGAVEGEERAVEEAAAPDTTEADVFGAGRVEVGVDPPGGCVVFGDGGEEGVDEGGEVGEC